MIDNFVSMIDERLLQSLSMTLAGQGKITQRVRDWLARGATFGQRSAGAESPSGSGSLVATHVVRSNVATQYRRVAGCMPRSSGTLLPLASVRETSVIKISHSAKSVKVTFALPADETAAGCSVVGDFNGWQPGVHQLRRRSNGTRSASVTFPIGTRTRFRYLSNNGHWFSDPDVIEFDGPDSVLAV